MRKIRKVYNAKVVVVIVASVFFCNATLHPSPISKDSLRVPLKSYIEARGWEERRLASLSTDRLIQEAEKAMPRWDEEKPDWRQFNDVVGLLKERRDVVKVSVVFGPGFKHKSSISFDETHFKADLQRLMTFRLGGEKLNKPFALFALEENIKTHVEEGMALVVERERKTKKETNYRVISFSDNGKGPIDKDTGKLISIEEILKHGVSKGKKGRGLGLTYATRCHPDLSIIHTPTVTTSNETMQGWVKIVKGRLSERGIVFLDPEILYERENYRTYGFKVEIIFLDNPEDYEDVLQDLIEIEKKEKIHMRHRGQPVSVSARTDI
jgi:hypothetical protein